MSAKRRSDSFDEWIEIHDGEVASADDLGRALDMERKLNARLQAELAKKDEELARERARNNNLVTEARRQTMRITTLTRQLGLLTRQASVQAVVISKRTLARQDRLARKTPKHHACLIDRTSPHARVARKHQIRSKSHRTHHNTAGRNKRFTGFV